MKRALVLALALLASACAPHGSGSGDGIVLSAAAVISSNESSSVRAEKLAKIADTLLSTGSAQQAGEVAAIAVEIDPSNSRAGLIVAVSKPLALLRGFISRVNGYIGNSPIYYGTTFQKAIKAMSDAHSNNYGTPKASFDNFLFEKVNAERPVFSSEIPLQETLDNVITSFDELRKYAKAHRDESITISATTTLIPDLIERYANACLVHEDTKLNYRLECPPDSTRSLVILDRADFELMIDMASYYELSLSLLAAYDIRGLSKSSASINYNTVYPGYGYGSQDSYYSDAWSQLIAKVPEFGKLRSTSHLSDMKNMGLDLVNGLNWAKSNQSILCPTGTSDGSNRVGKLFNQGFCYGGGLEFATDVVEAIAAGKTIKTMLPDGSKTDIAPSAFLDKPISDLRNLGEIKFAKNQVVSIGDSTLGGVFPKGDFNEVLGQPKPTPSPTPAAP